ncbi:uncharacterized protein LOC131209242 [Anopheles bellator]|uniref:uncharacterized protein LOC131209242 n=1 Tax=Anopheles bellator TaxID=139047 RepID=UPI0026490586|nr:uncharacterized protein LOC131209242 [Anopheles bellator]
MLPANVMSFMKKMVATDEASHQQPSMENTGAFGKLKQTLSTSLLTAQDRVNKMSPRPSLVPDTSDSAHTADDPYKDGAAADKAAGGGGDGSNKFNTRSGSCRICLKSFKPNDFKKTCVECDQKVCEDCASYSKLQDSDDRDLWRCSVCRRKMASRICIPQESTDSALEVPVMETLQRRHSDIKLGFSQHLDDGRGTALAPPRSPELRRHSDVSPASLKELEKLKGGHSAAPSRSASPPGRKEMELGTPRVFSRRPSTKMSRQHSYDDEFKTMSSDSNLAEAGLNLPPPMPRRKSAYDVYAPGVLVNAMQSVKLTADDMEKISTSRRASMKIMGGDGDFAGDDHSMADLKAAGLMVDDDRRHKRRGSQLPDISALKDKSAQNAANMNISVYQCPALEDLEAPKRQTSLDGEGIKIVIHDADAGPLCAAKRSVTLRRDPSDKAHRTRGFGMRVVGGKTGTDGRLFAYIVWTVPGGPAEKGGLQQGDKILEWCGASLTDRSFEEVCAIMDRTGDTAELLVEHATDFKMCELLDEGGMGMNVVGSTYGGSSNSTRALPETNVHTLTSESEATVDKSPSSPTRRKLPKTPV